MKIIVSILMLFTLNVLADEQTLSETAYDFAKASIGKGKPVFIQLGTKLCHSCKTMGKSLYKIKEKNENYNISYIDIYKDERVIEKFNIIAIPMQVIYNESGEEVYRNVGVIERDELNKLFKTYKF